MRENGIVAVRVEKRYKAMLVSANPNVVKGRCPYLSESLPAVTPQIKKIISNGIILTPASSGLKRKMSWK